MLILPNHAASIMSISSQPTKRRRLNDGGSALSKPFKSPWKAADRLGEDAGGAVDTSKDQHRENNQAAITNSSHPNTQPTIIPRRKPTQNQSSPGNPQNDPQFFTLQKRHSALLLQLSTLRQSLDTAQQALKIASSSSDTELETLITKWKLASREAAEEVFRGAKDRVNRMGGVGAWRERSRKKPNGWDEETPQMDVEEMGEEQREQLEIQKEELEAERRKYNTGKEAEVVEKDDDVSTFIELPVANL
jgi:hypothetical protein